MTKKNIPDEPVLNMTDAPNQASGAEIIIFPINKIVRMAPEPDEIDVGERKEKTRKRRADNIVAELCNGIINELQEEYDVDVAEKKFQKDFSYTIEVLRAAVYRSLELNHPFHNYIDEYVQVATKEEIETMRQKNKNAEVEPEATA